MAHIDGHRCRFISRNGNRLQFPQLAEEVAYSVRAYRGVLDGEIVALDGAGLPHFNRLLFRRAGAWPVFYAFDALSIETQDLRTLPLEPVRTQVCRSQEEVLSAGEQWKVAMISEGWTDT